MTGVCNGELNGHNLEGWVWAGLDDVHGLYNDYFSTARTPSAPQWLGMGPGPDAYTDSTAYVGGGNIISTEGTADKDSNYYSLAYDPGSQTVTLFQLGGFFFRETATVPAPSTALLLILGGFVMRQRSSRGKLFKK
ncbi:MAG: hypothetical protein AB8B48_09625 [Pseudomonadales bacterium]